MSDRLRKPGLGWLFQGARDLRRRWAVYFGWKSNRINSKLGNLAGSPLSPLSRPVGRQQEMVMSKKTWLLKVNRGKKVVNVMIEKEKGNPKIHRLCVIHLYEFDFGAMEQYRSIDWPALISAVRAQV